MSAFRRVILVVLDSLGIGELPDADAFGDVGSHTLRSISKSDKFSIPNLSKLGLGRIEKQDFLPYEKNPAAAFGRMAEKSMGKDTTVGHWELAGIVSASPFPTYPQGFPKEILETFEKRTGRGVLCNLPYSGTEVIKRYGKEHLETGKYIVYTSADSVFQIAAHEEKIPLEELYRDCRIAREILQGEHGVGRVIARPFTGSEGNFTRTANRKDFSLEPTGKTLPDAVKEAGMDSIFIGKISDIFASRGATETIKTRSNDHGMEEILKAVKKDFCGLLFANLVEFDSQYGHRNDVDGYAAALSRFDDFLPSLYGELKDEDLLVITADHGCDPGTPSTDHSREYVPVLLFGKGVTPCDLGTRSGFGDLGATLAEALGLDNIWQAESFLHSILGERT